MAEESQDGQDKTEEPSQRKLDKAREEGQFLRSQDTSIAVLLISVAAILYFFGSTAGDRYIDLMHRALEFDESIILSPESIRFRGSAAGSPPIYRSITGASSSNSKAPTKI